MDWESNPKLLFQIIYDQTYNHDFTKLTIHKFNNRFCLTLTDCFSLLPPHRVIFGHIIGQFRRIIGHHCRNFIENKRKSPKRTEMMNKSKLVFGCTLRPGSIFKDFLIQIMDF